MGDLISRQAAIDLVKDVCNEIMSGCGSHYDEETDDEVFNDILEVDAILKCNKEVRIALKHMPSAQPETHDKRTETHACDLISKQAAIDEIDEWIKAFLEQGHKESAADACLIQDGIIQLPSAQPELSGWCHDCKEYDKEHHCCPRWNRVIKTALADVHSEQQWIPCGERLPEENGQYLITVKYEHVDDYEDIYSEHGEWVDGKWDMFSFGHCGKVENIIAWMPLPEPYKGEQE